jgi:transcriptional regulator with XRE-family HTH domain
VTTEGTERGREVNRYVSLRLRQLRTQRGLSQKQAGDLLSTLTRTRWSVQAVSRAELCDGVYIKRWNVDDLYVLAAAFDVPVAYFLPQPAEEDHSAKRFQQVS